MAATYHELHPDWSRAKEVLVGKLEKQYGIDAYAGLCWDERDMTVGRSGTPLMSMDIHKLAVRVAEHYSKRAEFDFENVHKYANAAARGEAV